MNTHTSISSIEEEFLDNFSSHHTRKSYQRDIQKFLEYFLDFYGDLCDDTFNYRLVERQHIIKYRNWLAEIGGVNGGPSAPKTIARNLASLSSYFAYLVEKNLADHNPVTSVKRPRREVLSPTNALKRKQVQELLASINQNKKSGPLHLALLLTFFTTGLRKSEVLGLKRKHLVQLGDEMVIEYRGKGGKMGRKAIHPICLEGINRYLVWMESEGRKHHPEDWLFQPTRNPYRPGHLNRPLNPKTINEILDHYSKKAGLGVKISPHSARATFITELLDMGVDIYRVALEVGHSSVKTTQEYDKRKKEMEGDLLQKLYNLT